MGMKIKFIRTMIIGTIQYDIGDIIEPPATQRDVLLARGICVPCRPDEKKPQPKETNKAPEAQHPEAATAPEPEQPSRRRRPRSRSTEQEITDVSDDG